MPAHIASLLLAVLIAIVAPVAALAVQPDEVLDDPVMEKKAREISAELRCLVCQNQSIDDSDAPLARDLRLLVRERLKKGDSESEIIDFLVARYGEFVLLRPPFSAKTYLLWFAPLLLLGVGIYLAYRIFGGKRSAVPSPTPLSDSEQASLDRILKDGRS